MTRISTKNQVTLPVEVLRGAGLGPGDTLKVETSGAGRLVLTRIDELVSRYSGSIDSGGELRQRAERLRDEWG